MENKKLLLGVAFLIVCLCLGKSDALQTDLGQRHAPVAPGVAGAVSDHIQERSIPAHLNDSGSARKIDAHVVIIPSKSQSRLGKLFVFLPGTNAAPSHFRYILRAGALRGFHSIGLNYPNTISIASLCGHRIESDCFWNVRREIITGQDLSPFLNIKPTDSIQHRLIALIRHLDQHYPAEGWGGFLVNGEIDWSKITLAGHSQGGGHAAVLAKLYSVNRAIYFSSPPDWNVPRNQVAEWLAKPGLTPIQNQYAFSHAKDSVVPALQLQQIWRSLGLSELAPVAHLDSTLTPSIKSHQLLTRFEPKRSFFTQVDKAVFHAMLVMDEATPKGISGEALFAPIWNYLCFDTNFASTK